MCRSHDEEVEEEEVENSVLLTAARERREAVVVRRKISSKIGQVENCLSGSGHVPTFDNPLGTGMEKAKREWKGARGGPEASQRSSMGRRKRHFGRNLLGK